MFGQIRNNQIRIPNVQTRPTVQDQTTTLQIEKIDLGEKMLVLIEDVPQTTTPIAKITGRELRIRIEDTQEDILLDLPFAVDVDQSSVFSQNGIIEITLAKSSDIENSSDMKEYVLKNE